MAEKKYHMSIDLTMSVIDGKWKSLILCHLGGNSLRNGELLRRIPNISQKVLTQQLKEMIEDGVVKRTEFSGLPLHVEYSLTDEGKSLRQIFIDMSIWGEEHAAKLNESGQKVSFASQDYCGYLKIDNHDNRAEQKIVNL